MRGGERLPLLQQFPTSPARLPRRAHPQKRRAGQRAADPELWGIHGAVRDLRQHRRCLRNRRADLRRRCPRRRGGGIAVQRRPRHAACPFRGDKERLLAQDNARDHVEQLQASVSLLRSAEVSLLRKRVRGRSHIEPDAGAQRARLREAVRVQSRRGGRQRRAVAGRATRLRQRVCCNRGEARLDETVSAHHCSDFECRRHCHHYRCLFDNNEASKFSQRTEKLFLEIHFFIRKNVRFYFK